MPDGSLMTQNKVEKPVAPSTLSLSGVLETLSDPVRREIICRLSVKPELCNSFGDLGTKSNLSYHFARLRRAGLTNTEKAGTCRVLSLRKQELNRAFPGLLRVILKAMLAEKRANT